MEKYMASEMELLEKTIDQFTALQRIKNAQDPMKEVEYQLAIVKAKLESFGVVVENLNLEQIALLNVNKNLNNENGETLISGYISLIL